MGDLKDNSPEVIRINETAHTLSIKENKKAEAEFKMLINKVETLFWTLANNNKFTEAEEDYFFNEYFQKDLFRIDEMVCKEFYMKLLNR